MATFARQVLNALIPRGSAWAPKYDGGFDRLLDGISDCFQVLRAVGGSLADLRHPMTTQQLADLEREFGVVGDTTTAEAVRRIYLHGVVYGDVGTGSEDNLELRLRAAGFDVCIHPNNPAVDPTSLLASIPVATCSVTPGSMSTCSLVAAATCSRSDSGSASILVNETLARAPIVYLLPSDYRYWSFLFWVGGEMTGADFFVDWNMEMPHTAFWPGSGGAIVSKFLPLHNSGIRSLMVGPDGTVDLDDQRIQPDTTIATLASFYRMADDGGFAMQLSGISPVEVEEISPNGTIHFCTSKDTHWYGVGFANRCGGLGFETSYPDVIVDGDCEAVGVADWTAVQCTLSKNAVSPHGGTKWLKVLADAGAGVKYPQWNQVILTIGKDYLVSGWAHGDATNSPVLFDSPNILWTGTSSTSWQSFSAQFTAASTTLVGYFTLSDPAGTEFIGWDDITVYNLTDGCPVDFVPTFTTDFKAKFDATTDFSVTWTDTNLRDMLGFTAALSGDNTYTATYTPQYSWFPARVRADNDEWYLDSKAQWKGSESRTGNVCGLRTGASIYRTTLQYEALPDYEAIRARALTAAQDVRSLEYFAAQSRECWGAIDAPSPSGFYFFPDYTAVLIQASASYTSGDVTTFHRTSSPGTFAFCQFDSDWHPKFKPTIRSSQSDWYDVDVDIHTATAPTWTGA